MGYFALNVDAFPNALKVFRQRSHKRILESVTGCINSFYELDATNEKIRAIPMVSCISVALPCAEFVGTQHFPGGDRGWRAVAAGIRIGGEPADLAFPAGLSRLASGGFCCSSLGAFVLFIRPVF